MKACEVHVGLNSFLWFQRNFKLIQCPTFENLGRKLLILKHVDFEGQTNERNNIQVFVKVIKH